MRGVPHEKKNLGIFLAEKKKEAAPKKGRKNNDKSEKEKRRFRLTLFLRERGGAKGEGNDKQLWREGCMPKGFVWEKEIAKDRVEKKGPYVGRGTALGAPVGVRASTGKKVP